jgi:kynurenine formamidase
MILIDLTLPVPTQQGGVPTCQLEQRPLKAGDLPYTGMIYHLRHDSMAGTYVDFPGHIRETDDGLDSVTYPIEKLYRVPAAIVHLDRASGSGRIGARELADACPKATAAEALIVNALGRRRFDEIEDRSVYLGREAIRWIIDSGFHLLVSDVYESNSDPQKVFNDLFAARVSTVCCPINLDRIDRPTVRLTVLPLRVIAATQLPCRVVAEIE